jgi:hypothetical protein
LLGVRLPFWEEGEKKEEDEEERKKHTFTIKNVKRKREEEKEEEEEETSFIFLFYFIYLFYLFIYFIYFYLVDLDEPIVVHPAPGVRTKQVATMPQRQASPLPVKPKRSYHRRHPSEVVKTEIRRLVNNKELSIYDICELISDVIQPYLIK